MNVLEPITRRALLQPDAPALIAGAATVSYGRLMRDVAALGNRLCDEGVGRGQVVAVAADGLLPHVLITLAIAHAGAVSIPFRSLAPDRTAPALAISGVDALVHNQTASLNEQFSSIPKHLSLRELASAAPRLNRPAVASEPAEIFRIGYSSGTTGLAKPVKFTHGALIVRAQLLRHFAPSTATERSMITLAPALQFAVGHWLSTLMSGGAVVSAAGSAEQILDAMRAHEVSFLLTSPGTAVALLQQAQSHSRAGAVGPCLKTLCIGGAPIAPPLQDLLREHLCRNLVINYGMAEAGGLIAQADDNLLRSAPTCAGRVLPWVELQAVDETGAPLPPGSQGRLRVRTPYLGLGYASDDAETAQAFRNGWFYSGDTGMVTVDGLVYLGGRSDVLNVGGNKVSPERIEAVIARDPAVLECVVLTLPDEMQQQKLVAAVVARQGFDPQALRSRCLRELGAPLSPTAVILVERLPHNAGGKIQRNEVAAFLQAQAPAK
jgi:acyl-coenzyme A synthetase/AMP-(fatty) acid ligase